MPSHERNKRKKTTELSKAALKCGRLDRMFKRVTNQTGPSSQPDVATEPNVSQHESDDDPDSQPGASIECQPGGLSRKKTAIKTVLSWGFDWLEFELEKDEVLQVWCKLCKEYYKDRLEESPINPGQVQVCDLDAYVGGTSRVKKCNAVGHMRSKTHTEAVRVLCPEGDSPLVRHFKQRDEMKHQQMLKLFDIAYTVAYSEQSFQMYVTIAKLEAKHHVDLGQRYLNDKSCRQFVGYIASSFLDDLQAEMAVQPFYCSLLFDSSTDKTLTEREIVSIKYLRNGTPTTKLLGICKPASGTADSIYASILEKANAVGLDLERSCVAMVADGASVNFGSKQGVLTKMQQDMPWLMKFHCVAHKLELALKDAFKGSYYTQIDDLMMNLYYMYHRSAKKWKQLESIAEVLSQDILKPVRATGTRWIPHRRAALKVLDRDYISLVSQFEDAGSGLRKDIPPADAAKMRGYLRRLKSMEFVLPFAFYQDLVEDLAELSTSLQAEILPLCSLRTAIQAVTMDLQAKLTTPGERVTQVLNGVTEENEWTFREQQLTCAANTLDKFKKGSAEVLAKVLDCMGIRFQDILNHPTLLAADIMDASNMPQEVPLLANYGNDQVGELADHFGGILSANGCVMEAIPREWSRLKLELQRRQELNPGEAFTALWQSIMTQKAGRFPNIAQLFNIILVFPFATALVERQFSYLKRFLGDWRLGLGHGTLEDLLRICCDGPEIPDFDPEPAVDKWWDDAHRRGT